MPLDLTAAPTYEQVRMLPGVVAWVAGATVSVSCAAASSEDVRPKDPADQTGMVALVALAVATPLAALLVERLIDRRRRASSDPMGRSPFATLRILQITYSAAIFLLGATGVSSSSDSRYAQFCLFTFALVQAPGLLILCGAITTEIRRSDNATARTELVEILAAHDASLAVSRGPIHAGETPLKDVAPTVSLFGGRVRVSITFRKR